ncbi:hypothetical protein LTS18_002943 [Coniosporium uncinatum]|uniref:Uncharacterized protein n=1 Tax=Coniosporium uncinatum TaxID=93489 RepID=A0ACC3DYZ1_9PEZI|nr:hypothetical protein LTS18_002943 [Coniosporium uncinatum]
MYPNRGHSQGRPPSRTDYDNDEHAATYGEIAATDIEDDQAAASHTTRAHFFRPYWWDRSLTAWRERP